MKTPKRYDNSIVRDRLIGYYSYKQLCEDFPRLEDIFVGVSRLNYDGNSRPLSTVRLFQAITALDTISVENVMDMYQCSERHARKLAGALRVISGMLETELRRTGDID